jgi:hypothetical protein
LAEIKAQLGLLPNQPHVKIPKAKSTVKQDGKELEEALEKILAELERDVNKLREPKVRRPPAKR